MLFALLRFSSAAIHFLVHSPVYFIEILVCEIARTIYKDDELTETVGNFKIGFHFGPWTVNLESFCL